MPQWFIVAMHLPAVTAVELGIPILIVGSIFLIIGWLPERSRKYPEVLENTMTPIPDYYLKQA
jgi:cellobiose-specific phosphotransferase system component IIC